MHQRFVIFTPSPQCSQATISYAVRFPLAFFLGVSAIVRSGKEITLAAGLHQLYSACGCSLWASRSTWLKPYTTWNPTSLCIVDKHTGWQRLLQLLNLLRILQDERVQVSWAADLELGLGRLLVALYACSCISISLRPSTHIRSLCFDRSPPFLYFSRVLLELVDTYRKHPCVYKSQWTVIPISIPLPFCHIWGRGKTHVLNVRDFLRHLGVCRLRPWEMEMSRFLMWDRKLVVGVSQPARLFR